MTAFCNSDQSGKDIVPISLARRVPGGEGWEQKWVLRGEQCAKCLQTVSTLNIQFYPQESHEERGFNMSFIDNIIHTIHKIIISPYQIICASDTNSSIISTASQILGPDLSRICTILSSESVEFSFSISSVILSYSSLFWTNLKIISRSSFIYKI